MKKIQTKDLTIIAMFIALTTVATMSIQVPIPATKGYINIGDTVLICAGLLLGRTAGGLAGSIGSALADLLSGYGYYAPITFVVKGIEGFLAGYLKEKTKINFVICGLIAGLVMALGYFIAEGTILYNFQAATASLPANIMQGIGGSILASILYKAIEKTKVLEKINDN